MVDAEREPDRAKPKEATTVWLMRHGEADGMHGRCCGHFDAPLSMAGLEQAKRVAAQLAHESISRMFSSNLKRALETAQIVAEPHGLAVEAVDDLAEMNFGDLEGLRYEEAQERFPAVYHSWMTRPTETQFPNGESYRQMSARVLRAFDSILQRHRNQSIGIVAHAGVIRVVLRRALSIPDSEIFRLAQQHCAINRIRYVEEVPMVELING
jgi:alpha-ribazole phosphatase